MFRKWFICTLLLVLLPLASSCVSQPGVYTFDKSRLYPENSKDEVWSKIIRFFSERNIQIKTVEKDSGIIYAEVTRFDPEELVTYADCGQGQKQTTVIDVRRIQAGIIKLNVFVVENSEGTSVSVNTDYKAEAIPNSIFASGDKIYIQNCNSKGTLEKSILDYVQ